MTAFPKDDLVQLADLGVDGISEVDAGTYWVKENDIIDTGRWDIQYRLVFGFQAEGADHIDFFSVIYSVSAAEMQDGEPFEYDPDPVPVKPVTASFVTAVVYRETV